MSDTDPTMNDYDWITSDMFDAQLTAEIAKMSAAEILAMPGVYEALAEELNNAVLDALERARDE